MKTRLALCAICLALWPAGGLARQAQPTATMKFVIVDASGSETAVTHLDFDYTSYVPIGLYTPVHELNGLRVRQGDGELTMRWSNIALVKLQPQRVYWVRREGKRLEFSEKSKWEEASKGAIAGEWGEGYRFSGVVQLVSGVTRAVELVPVSRPLSGPRELGEYRVALENVREIRVIR